MPAEHSISTQDIERSLTRLDACIKELQRFNCSNVGRADPTLIALSARITDTLRRCFGDSSASYDTFKGASILQSNTLTSDRVYHSQQAAHRISQSTLLLEEAKRVLKEDLADLEHEQSKALSPIVVETSPPSRRIFVVHGHEEGPRESVARFLAQLGFEPIILHEQANQGRTVMEKVEAHGDVSFAVVLLTPDDQGCANGGTPEPRARQNVLLELGYFLGRLGRNKVCALKRGIVEIPSDFAGVVWESMDGGGWKQALGRELEAAGHEIDWNKVMRV
ncbi:nucleotide-binding protein [Pseudomonas koreensis]|uniref:Nucleotide-binding protein n=1 Tax=Pseudomonas koreensis TaxID=198620 RepID=A0A9X2XJC7_9PSED|nr:nucleotide-binding protein [Pseudomonas koreensis]MCU7250344.1 nucleotide-binding protein [Pseudomonas koreensis]